MPTDKDLLSVVVPCYNEERRLVEGLAALTTYLKGRRPYEILVVDDGSRDGTLALARSQADRDPAIRVLGLPRNRGKGAVVREGMLAARGSRILMTDVDLSSPIDELPKLDAALDRADVAIGSRALAASSIEVRQSGRRENLGRSFNIAVRLMLLPGLFDTQCGFKLWKAGAAKDVFRRLTLDRFAFDVEALWAARSRGWRIAEVPVRWRHDDRSTVRVGRDGLRMGLDLWRILGRRLLGWPTS
jgi:dolichyl-phosphate beta-glucosyltransferase